MSSTKAKRLSISKKVRFEVFKRDSFTCQYCGASAPSVILNVDHIHPASKGGDNNILNLVTSCFSCNSGKSDRIISDGAALSKQIAQAKQLSERKEQIQMMSKWHQALADLDSFALEEVRKHINKNLEDANRSVADHFLNSEIKKCLKKYGIKITLESVSRSAGQYLKDVNSSDDRNDFLEKIPKIAYWVNEEIKNPHLSEIRKISFKAKRKWWGCYVNQLISDLVDLNENACVPLTTLSRFVDESKGITEFRKLVASFLEQKNG